jgi:hypothetical protein
MVRIHPDPPTETGRQEARIYGAIAQLGERLLCKQEVTGSIPVGSTNKTQAPGGRDIQEAAINVRGDARLIGASSKQEALIGCSLTIWDRR